MKVATRLFLPFLAAAFLLPTAGLALANHSSSRPAKTKALVNLGTATVNHKSTKVLVGPKGLTLYRQTTGDTGTIACKGQCLKAWPPLLLPKGMKKPSHGSGVVDKLGTIKRPDISNSAKQVTYDGWPLYYWQGDTKRGQATGQGIFHFVVVPPAPIVSFHINITNTGATWGTVTVKGTYHNKAFTKSCGNQSCTVNMHAGVTVTLSQTATDQSSWPFSGWVIKSADGHVNRTSSASSIKLTSSDDYTVNANYRLA